MMNAVSSHLHLWSRASVIAKKTVMIWAHFIFFAFNVY